MAKKQLRNKLADDGPETRKKASRKEKAAVVVKEFKPKQKNNPPKAIRHKPSDVLAISLNDVNPKLEADFDRVMPEPELIKDDATFPEPPPQKTAKPRGRPPKEKPAIASTEKPDAAPKVVRKPKKKKIFVLDTSVILYNHNSINSFDDNDVAIPITVLEELDNFKKGNDTKNFEAREFIRIIDTLSENATLTDWIPLVKSKGGSFKVVMNERSDMDARKIFDDNKPDHRILNAAIGLVQEYPDRKVILVSKDINLRLKAKSLNITAEDFLTGKIKDVEGLYTGISTINNLSSKVIDKLYQQGYCILR